MYDRDAIALLRPSRGTHVDPLDAALAVLFGLLMALSFTNSLSLAGGLHDDIDDMVLGAVSCNIAWGLVDAVIFMLSRAIIRVRSAHLIAYVHAAAYDKARQVVLDALPDGVEEVLDPEDLDAALRHAHDQHKPLHRPRLWNPADLRGAALVCLLVVLATLPVTLPFELFDDLTTAMAVSNAVALTMMLITGMLLGNSVGGRGWAMGMTMTAVGAGLSVMTLVLGG